MWNKLYSSTCIWPGIKKLSSIGVPGKPRITNTELEVDVDDFTVTWSAPLYNGGDDNLKYRLEWRMKPITDDTEVGKEENIAETQFQITGLEDNKEYEVKLFSVNRRGSSDPDIKTFKTKADPGECNCGSIPFHKHTVKPDNTHLVNPVKVSRPVGDQIERVSLYHRGYSQYN